jgi:hypothetical protein
LSRGEADGGDMAEAIEQLVSATVASLQAPDSNDGAGAAAPDIKASRKKAPDTSRARTV